MGLARTLSQLQKLTDTLPRVTQASRDRSQGALLGISIWVYHLAFPVTRLSRRVPPTVFGVPRLNLHLFPPIGC